MSGGLAALSMAWIAAEAALPLEWKLSGLFRFDGDLWVALSEGPAFDDYTGAGVGPVRCPALTLMPVIAVLAHLSAALARAKGLDVERPVGCIRWR